MTFHPFNIDLIEKVSRSLKIQSTQHNPECSLQIIPKREHDKSLNLHFDPEQQLLETLDQWLAQNLIEEPETENSTSYTQKSSLSKRSQSFLTTVAEIVNKEPESSKFSDSYKTPVQPKKTFLLEQAFEHIQNTQRKSTVLSRYL